MISQMLAFRRYSASMEAVARRRSVRKGVLRNFAIFTGKHLSATGLTPATLLRKRLCHRRFPLNYAEFLRTPICNKNSG